MGSGLLGSANKDEQFKDEYDPAKPNDYEAIRSQREKDTHQAQEEADRQEELRLLQVNAVGTARPSSRTAFYKTTTDIG